MHPRSGAACWVRVRARQLPKGRAKLPPPIYTMRSMVTVPNHTNLLTFSF